MGEVAFKKIQWGIEGTAGTAVPATGIVLGTITVPADRKPQYPVETIGRRADSIRSAIYQIHADGIVLRFDHGYYQCLPTLFALATTGSPTTGSQVTSGQGDYAWVQSPSMTAANSQKTATIEFGDDTEQYEIEYCLVKRITIAGKLGADAPVSIEAELFGKQISVVDFTTLSLPTTIEPIVANNAKIYIDTTWAGLGGTQKTSLLREFSVEILTGNHPKFYGNSKMMSASGEGKFGVMATFTFEGNSDGDAQFDLFQAGTARAIRLSIPGSQIGSGTTYDLRLDMWGSYEEIIPLGSEADGNNLHTAIFHGYLDTTSGSMLALRTVTSGSTLAG